MQNFLMKCIECRKEFNDFDRIRCDCNGLLEIVHDIEKLKETVSVKNFDKRLGFKNAPFNSGVWRYKELVAPIENKHIISRPEGNTNLYFSKMVSSFAHVKNLWLKAEGENPTMSFKDRGMTVAISAAKKLGYEKVACASTGNTSASMASYAAFADMDGFVFIPEGNISMGKLAQALAYGSKTLQVEGNFDTAMELVQEACSKLGLYLLNSVNPFRIEGQKTIIIEALHQLNFKAPDWVVLPGGNLGNTSAIGKALKELHEIGIIDSIPRVATIQASGANPFYESFRDGFEKFSAVKNPQTIATAIKIGSPVSWKKAAEVIRYTNGVVEEVSDQDIMDAKACVDRAGIGCEPASAASVAGLKKLVEKKVIKEYETVVAILTGNMLKDTDAIVNYHNGTLSGIKSSNTNMPVKVKGNIEEIKKFLG